MKINTGTASQPNFCRQMIWVDFDNDSDLDIFINGGYVSEQAAEDIVSYPTILYYENQGTGRRPHFVESSQHNTLLAQLNNDSPRSLIFEDIAQDQDFDAIIGEDYSVVSYYENTGSVGDNGQPIFVKQRTVQDNVFANVFSNYPSLVDLDNDGDKEVFSSLGNLTYHQNISLASRTLPNLYALPKTGLYNRPRQVSLNCVDCETIYYLLETVPQNRLNLSELESAEYTAPIPITSNTLVHFVAIDAQGDISPVQTESYLIDTTLPEIKISSPTNHRTLASMPLIEGTAVDPDGVGLDRVELQINNGPLYISPDNDNPFTHLLTWIPLEQTSKVFRLSSNGRWYCHFPDRTFPTGTYTIIARAFDKAGNQSNEDIITVTLDEVDNQPPNP